MSDAFAATDPAVRLWRRESVGMVTLRGDLADARLAAAVDAATGCPLPAVRKIALAGECGVAWMSPDELMLFLAAGAAPAAASEIAGALAGMHHLAVDVSDARVLFRLEGPGAREVLAKGAPVDLAPGAFGPLDFRRTRLGQVAAAFWMPAPETIDLMCFRSLAAFVADWLAHAARPGSLPGHLRESG
jgi:sarcosine oxidase subunit gamma